MHNFISLIVVMAAVTAAVGLVGCAPASPPSRQIGKEPFGTTPEGREVDLYVLRNAKGCEAGICTYGGRVVSLKVPDRQGNLGDVVLGFDSLADYMKDNPYLGSLVGRYGNRIGNARFTLGGKQYVLAANNGPNHLHGGMKGFDKVVWDARPLQNDQEPGLELRYVSKDGEEGYPGTLTVVALYTLTADSALRLDYTATTDQDTIVNLTQHSYFNLAGKGDVLGYEAMINADQFTPVDSTLIPTGELRSVKGTPFDFTTPTPIGARINQDDEQLKFGGGYDHNWVINKPAGQLDLMARVHDPASGRILEVLSSEPGLQFYTGNFLDGKLVGKGRWAYEPRTGFCMEPQHYPDSPNKAEFPSVVLKPGQMYKNTIIYRFSAK